MLKEWKPYQEFVEEYLATQSIFVEPTLRTALGQCLRMDRPGKPTLVWIHVEDMWTIFYWNWIHGGWRN